MPILQCAGHYVDDYNANLQHFSGSFQLYRGNISFFLWSIASFGLAQPVGAKTVFLIGCQVEPVAFLSLCGNCWLRFYGADYMAMELSPSCVKTHACGFSKALRWDLITVSASNTK
ncbi:hypothetical protein TcCL_NonESM02418 [Trypanosoma cruzi]|nr:hypothetical protein TcCL_NonESM02418 [Trypanosoma cruzi]